MYESWEDGVIKWFYVYSPGMTPIVFFEIAEDRNGLEVYCFTVRRHIK